MGFNPPATPNRTSGSKRMDGWTYVILSQIVIFIVPSEKMECHRLIHLKAESSRKNRLFYIPLKKKNAFLLFISSGVSLIYIAFIC